MARLPAEPSAVTDGEGAAAARMRRALPSPSVTPVALRIAGVDPERRFAGGEAQVLGLTLALAHAGHETELLCDPAGELWQRASAAGIVCQPLRIRNSIDLAAGFRLRRLICARRYDVVHFHTARAHALAPYAHWLGAAAGDEQARPTRPRLFVTRRMDYPPNRLFAPWLYNRAVDGVAAISPSVATALAAAGVARDRIALIPSGVDCARFTPPGASRRHEARMALSLTEDQIAIGTVGMLEPRKGHRFLIGALARMRQSNRGLGWRCFIAGGGSLQADLMNQIAALETSNQLPHGAIRLLGTSPDPYPLLSAARPLRYAVTRRRSRCRRARSDGGRPAGGSQRGRWPA